MKTKFQLLAVFVIAALATLFAQGPLTPPGAPAPTMKSLDQIEARTPISTAPFTIAQSGSYYLTANLNVANGTAITIAANNVTLDLNGFKISSTAFGGGTGSAILLQSVHNVAIFNGHIDGREVWDNAFLHGINWSSSPPINVRVTDVSVFGCGMNGINLGDNFSTVVERCTVDLVGGQGIRAGAGVVSRSTATRCGAEAIVAANASDCYAASTASYGLYVTNAANCMGTSANGTGIYAFTAQNCFGQGAGEDPGPGSPASGHGIYAFSATNCRGDSQFEIGVFAETAVNCYGKSSGTGTGVLASCATNCYGDGGGLFAILASNCRGTDNGSFGIGVNANLAIGCYGTGGPGGSGISAFKQYFCGSGPAIYPPTP